MGMTLVTVFGGSGFLGRRIVERLLLDGATVRVAARRPAAGAFGDDEESGRLTAVAADIRDADAVAAAVAQADGAVNAVSAYVERGGTTYEGIHGRGAANLARACARQGVGRLIHISGIGADAASPSRYIAARGHGELVVREAFPRATILRPSVMFGPDDAFLGNLAGIVRWLPVIPLVGGGRCRLQPVHVLDVAEAACRCLGSAAAEGAIYELGGPERPSLREIVERVARRLRRRPILLTLPVDVARPLAHLLEFLPRAALTVAQVDLLATDNLPSGLVPGLADLGIAPRGLADAIAALPAR
jgi:uncharacterized protein YbjT (DUF2867 family)